LEEDKDEDDGEETSRENKKRKVDAERGARAWNSRIPGTAVYSPLSLVHAADF